jgi:aldehyde:ferredoxin oxidoreductase
MYGWAGEILRVDLSKGETRREPLDLGFARKWLGGEGFGAKVLWDEVGPDIEDGLDPRNLLIYTCGPLTGTLAPSSGRLEIVTKSPLTGIFGDTNSGGHFAPALKNAGCDMLVIGGKADRPVYLWIDDGRVEIRDARHLWGKTVPETDRLIKEELGDKEVQVSCIGPGGENQVRFAILMNNIDRAPGWTGCGAVAGSKNLKAVVARGTKGVKIARPEEFEQACWQAREKVKEMRAFQNRRKMGTMFLLRALNRAGGAAMNNFNSSQCPESHLERVCGERWVENYVVSGMGCHGCMLHCKHYIRITDGSYGGLEGEGYEYGCISPYVFWYGSDNIEFAMAAVKYCNENGIDGAEPGMLLAWVTDCFKQGIITKEDIDGLVMEWGDEKVALELLRKITYREGCGDLLAEGLGRAAGKLRRGSEEYAYTIKGRPCVEGNIRSGYGAALAAATSTRGTDHLKGWPAFESAHAGPPELSTRYFGHPNAGNGRSHEGKGPMTVYNQSRLTLVDLMGTCKFHSWTVMDGLTNTDYAGLLSAALGIDFTAEDLMLIAERVYNLERAYDMRLGLSREDDSLPERYFKVPLNSGPQEGFVIKKSNFNKMLDDYYECRGWEMESGVPTRETLEKLDLKDVADDLKRQGFIL